MAVRRSVKIPPVNLPVIAIVRSAEEFRQATRLAALPAAFELRLDALHDVADGILADIRLLRSPIIITARSPSEGGANNLTIARRQSLLLRFLPVAAYLDVELRSRRSLQLVMQSALESGVALILSYHNLTRTPSCNDLVRRAQEAAAAGAAVFKVATRADEQFQVRTLLSFYDIAAKIMPVAAMGIGKLGLESRRLLIRRGSALNYAHLGRSAVEGQLSLPQLRDEIRRLKRRS